MLLLLAELAPTPSTRAHLIAGLETLARQARTEPGCIAYALHAKQDDPCALVLYELYADRAACDAHLASAPVQSLLARFDSLLSAPPRIRYFDTLAGHGRPFGA